MVRLLTLILLFTQTFSFSQNNYILNNFESRAIGKLNNGEFLLAGSSNNYPVVMKINSSYNILWSKQMNQTGQFLSLLVKNNNTYLAARLQQSYKLLKIDENGTVLWSLYNFQPSIGIATAPLKVYSDTLLTSFITEEGLTLFCLDTNGNQLWNKSITSINDPYSSLDVWKYKDEIYVACNFNSEQNILKFSTNGTLIWHKSYSHPQLNVNYVSNTIQHSNGIFILTGTSYFLKVDTSGTILDSKKIDYETLNLVAKSIYVNGKYYLIGYRDGFTTVSTYRYYISEFDSNFNPLRNIHLNNISNAPLFHLDLIYDGIDFHMLHFYNPASELLHFNDMDQIVCDTTHFSVTSTTLTGFTLTNHFSVNAGNPFVSGSSLLQNTSLLILPGCYYNGIENSNLPEREMYIFPNPNNGFFQLNFDNIENGELKIYNAIGQIVYSKKINTMETNLNLDLNINPGIYILTMMSDGNLLSKENIIIER